MGLARDSGQRAPGGQGGAVGGGSGDTDTITRRQSITAFFPAYNDAGTIPSMVISADMVLRSLTDDYEVIVVNDGSSDATAAMLAELKTRYPRLRVVTHLKNRGYGGALRSGFRYASKELVFYTDGDAQYDVRELPLLFAKLREDVDVVNGYKISRSDPWVRIVIGKLYHRITSRAFGINLRDVDCDFRLIRREVFDNIELTKNSGVICVEMMKKIQDAGYHVEQAPVSHFHRAYGISQFFNFRRVFRVGLDLLRLWNALVLRRRHLKGRDYGYAKRAQMAAPPRGPIATPAPPPAPAPDHRMQAPSAADALPAD